MTENNSLPTLISVPTERILTDYFVITLTTFRDHCKDSFLYATNMYRTQTPYTLQLVKKNFRFELCGVPIIRIISRIKNNSSVTIITF